MAKSKIFSEQNEEGNKKPESEKKPESSKEEKPFEDIDKTKKVEDLVSSYKSEKEKETISPVTGKPKRTYTKRKKKEDKKQEEIDPQLSAFAETSTLTASVALEILINKITPEQTLKESEKNQFNNAFSKFAEKYYPVVKRFGEEINLIIALGVIVIPRLGINLFTKKVTEKKETPKTTQKEDA